MSKKRKPQYTAEQKYEYHKKRMNDKSVTQNQRIYSTQWVDAFSDPWIDTNLPATEKEFERNKKYCDRSGRIWYKGFINGGKAAQKDKSASWKAYCERG